MQEVQNAQFATDLVVDVTATADQLQKSDAATSATNPRRKHMATLSAKNNKTELVLKKLRSAKGVSIATLSEVTGWQAHSVRGFLSAVVNKKLGLNLISETDKSGARRYRIAEVGNEAS